MQQPLVHVLVINWNGMDHLRACFDSLLAQSYENARFVLVDNASSDDSVSFVRDQYGADPRVEILECGANLGWSRGNNLGIARALAANADYVFLLNNDTATEPDAIAQLVAFAESRPEIGAVAPKMLLFDQPYLLNSVGIACSEIASAWDDGLGRVDSDAWSEPKPVLGVCGGAMLLRAASLRNTGFLPEDFEIYLDDLDLCLRLWNAGFECWFCPSARVRHKFSATMGVGARARHKYFLNNRNRVRLILRNYPVLRLPSVALKYALGEFRAIARAGLDQEFWKIGAQMRSWLQIISYLRPAIAHRRQSRASRVAPNRFWPMLRKDVTFFSGTPLPVDGWYAPQAVQGRNVKPISAKARATVEAGRLRVTHANCYPRLGDTRIDVIQGDCVLATLTTKSVDCAEFAVRGGDIEFVSRRVFKLEDTREPMDIGGWIAYEIVGAPGQPGDE